jgi:flagellar hook-length control protein FliK
MTAEPAQAESSPQVIPVSMPASPLEQAPPGIAPPETPRGGSGRSEGKPVVQAPPSPLRPAQSTGPSAMAAPLDVDQQTPPALEAAPRTRPDIARLSLSAATPEGAPAAGDDGAVSMAAPQPAPASRPSAPASARTKPVSEPVGPSAPAADPVSGQADLNQPQAAPPRPASIQLRAQAPIGLAAGVPLDRLNQTGDQPAGDGRAVASIDGMDLPSGRTERGSLDAPAPVARAPAAPPALQIAHQIVRAAHQRVERVMVQIEPAELGRVEVRLDFGHDGRMSALIATDRADALDLLQRDARALERSLEQAGLRLDSGGLSFALKRDGGHGQASAGFPSSELPGDPGSPRGDTDHEAQHRRPAMLSLRLLDLQV